MKDKSVPSTTSSQPSPEPRVPVAAQNAPLIALNAHRYHDGALIVTASHSVAAAMARLRQARPQLRAEAVLFVEDDSILDASQAASIRALGIAIRLCPGSSNGARLNRQIEAAIAEGFELFLRVDADDAIAPERLLRQVALFDAEAFDLIGAGLSYRHDGQSQSFAVIPPATPGAWDYMLNRYVLHQTMGFRIKALQATGLRYWDDRLEDKELLLRAKRAGLRIHNAPEVWGDYLVSPDARATPRMARLAYQLTRSYLRENGHNRLIPLAWLIYLTRRLLPVAWLRRLRSHLTRDAARMIAAE